MTEVVKINAPSEKSDSGERERERERDPPGLLRNYRPGIIIPFVFVRRARAFIVCARARARSERDRISVASRCASLFFTIQHNFNRLDSTQFHFDGANGCEISVFNANLIRQTSLSVAFVPVTVYRRV